MINGKIPTTILVATIVSEASSTLVLFLSEASAGCLHFRQNGNWLGHLRSQGQVSEGAFASQGTLTEPSPSFAKCPGVCEVLCLVKAINIYFAQQKPLFLPTASITGGSTEVNQLHLLWGPLSLLRRSSRGLCTPPGC